MKRNIRTALLALISAALLTACAVHTHQVGDGAQSGVEMKQKQWYILWGLVPLNEVDSAVLAEGADDYTIRTAKEVDDVLINIFTGYVTIHSRTVTVTK